MPVSLPRSNPSLTEQLTDQLSRSVDAQTRVRAARQLLDWVACTLAARHTPIADVLRNYADAQAPGHHLAIGLGPRDAQAASLWNGALGNVLEMDDLHRGSILHPGPIVIPAAIAVAQKRRVKANDFLDAIVRGYEATIRIGRAIGRSHYRYWHSTSTCGAFGAAAAAASALHLGREATVWALGNAGSRTGGLWQLMHENVMSKSLHNAEAAHSGVLAAELAGCGFSGPREILEGPQGLFAATSQDAAPELVSRDELHWLINEVSTKPWPACRHAHPAIDAARAACPLPIDVHTIARIDIHTYAEAVRFCDKPVPTTPAEARFSLQHAVAVALTRAMPALIDFTEVLLDDPQLDALRRLTSVNVDADFSAAFPQHYGARVVVTSCDGTIHHASLQDAWGDPEWPLQTEQLRDRAIKLMQWGRVDPTAAGGIADATLQLAHAGDESALADWFALLAEAY